MGTDQTSRREFFIRAGQGALATSALVAAGQSAVGEGSAGQDRAADRQSADKAPKRGHQRLSLEQLHRWEAMGYGMFIHFGMSTFVSNELPSGKDPASVYAPDRLDVDQWVSVARDAGMKYAVLTAKHVAGHCLWPSKHSAYTVANSGDRTDVVEKFVKACQTKGVLAGFYYCSWDNHHRFGSRTPSDPNVQWDWGPYDFVAMQEKIQANPGLYGYTTSLYQSFQTAQLTELLTQYGPIAEIWIDIPGVLGRGYRTFLYEYVARLQPETAIMMNSGISTGEDYNVAYAWPADLIAIERRLPPESAHKPWRTIEGREYYLPGEVCDPIGKQWFYVPGDEPRSDQELLDQLTACRQRRVNLLLDVPPDRHGVIPEVMVQSLMRLARKISA